MINFNRTLEVAGTSGFIQPIKLVQYDDTLPVGVFELVENGQPFDIPAGAKAKVRMRKADGKGVYNDATISGHTVQVVVTQQMTAAFGVGFLNIELSYDGGVKSSEPVQVVVLENAVQQGSIESTDEFLTLEEIVKQVETLRQQTAIDAAAASASKTAAASSATAAQAARTGAEAAESRVNAIVAGNEAYTKQESKNLFARALKAETAKAASLEIYPDEGSNVAVTAYGFTEQAGTGDASPNNVREITVGGVKLTKVDFVEIEELTAVAKSSWDKYAVFLVSGNVNSDRFGYSSNQKDLKKTSSDLLSFEGVALHTNNALYVSVDMSKSGVSKSESDSEIKRKALEYLRLRKIKIWYKPIKESDSSGVYVPIETNGDEYRCVCVRIDERLCDGDYVSTSGEEVHAYAFKEYRVSDMNNNEDYPGWVDYNLRDILGQVNTSYSGNVCNISNSISVNTVNTQAVYFNKSQLGGLTQTQFKEHYPDLVVQVILPYKTAKTYAHDHIYLEAYPDGHGKFTVSGEKLVSAKYNKNLNHAFSELWEAVSALGLV